MNAYRCALCAQSRLAALLVAAALLSLTAGVGSARAHRGPTPAGNGAVASAVRLVRGSGYGTRAGSPQVRALQRRLRDLDEAPGPIDGLFGPQTQSAVVRFQATHGLTIDGIVGPQTRHALRRASAATALRLGSGYDIPGGSAAVRALQRKLGHAGDNPGAIDGLYGPRTEAAVEDFQTRHGLAVDGIAGPRTQSRLVPPPHTTVRTMRPTPRRPEVVSHSVAAPVGEAIPARALALAAWLLALGLAGWQIIGRRRPTKPAAEQSSQQGRATPSASLRGGAIWRRSSAHSSAGRRRPMKPTPAADHGGRNPVSSEDDPGDADGGRSHG